MQVIIDLPDDVAQQLRTRWSDLPRGVLETIALEGYRSGELSRGQVGRILGFETPMATDRFLKDNGVYLNYTVADLEEDREALRHL